MVIKRGGGGVQGQLATSCTETTARPQGPTETQVTTGGPGGGEGAGGGRQKREGAEGQSSD